MINLFSASLKFAENFVGKGTCSVLGSTSESCIEFSNGWTRSKGEPLSSFVEKTDFLVSSEALIDGLCITSKETEFGSIGLAELCNGLTVNLLPFRFVDDIDLVPVVERYTAVEKTVSTKDVLSLLGSPNIGCWNEVRWMFNKMRPMLFMGSWMQADFEQFGDDSGKILFETLVKEFGDIQYPWEAVGYGFEAMVFKCQDTNKLRLHIDHS